MDQDSKVTQKSKEQSQNIKRTHSSLSKKSSKKGSMKKIPSYKKKNSVVMDMEKGRQMFSRSVIKNNQPTISMGLLNKVLQNKNLQKGISSEKQSEQQNQQDLTQQQKDSQTNLEKENEIGHYKSKGSSILGAKLGGGLSQIFKQGGLVNKIRSNKTRTKERKVKNNQENQEAFLINKKNRITNLFLALDSMDQKQKINKACRHIYDALHLRTPRNDLDTTQYCLLKFIFFWHNNTIWEYLLFFTALAVPLLSFFEPTNRFDTDYELPGFHFQVETVLIGLLCTDLILETIHRMSDYDRNWKEKFVKNNKYSAKFIIIILLVIDYVYFHTVFPTEALRIGRYFRPFLMLFWSGELRRAFKSIIYSLKEILELFIFFFLMTIIWALIGMQFISNLDGEVEYDKYKSNFNEFGTTANILYALISFDGYPDCMLPAITYSQYYYIYFISYLSLYILIFVPIPVAVVFEAFRNHRSKCVIMDRIKQRECLLYAFISLDFEDNKHIPFDVFYDFMSVLYLQKKRYKKRIKDFFLQIDINDSDNISLNEFFDIIDIMERLQQYRLPTFPDSAIWIKVRNWINRNLKIKIIAKSLWFELFMFIIVLGNSVVLLYGQFLSDDHPVQETFDLIDAICLYFYILEALIKGVGFGFEKYWEDGWNKFDVAMIVISILSSILFSILSTLKSLKSAKAGRLVKLTKINRMFKVCKAFRTVKFINFLFLGADAFNQVHLLIQRIFTCIPLIFKLTPIIGMVFYIYALIGLETFNTNTFETAHDIDNEYNENEYVSFTSFGDAILILFQVMIEAEWSAFTYYYAHTFDKFGASMLYFCTWHMVIQLILLSLLKGIVWEVFTVVESQHKETEKKQERIEEIDKHLKQTMSDKNLGDNENILKDDGVRQYEIILTDLHASFHSQILNESSSKTPQMENNNKLKNKVVNNNNILADLKEEANENEEDENDLQTIKSIINVPKSSKTTSQKSKMHKYLQKKNEDEDNNKDNNYNDDCVVTTQGDQNLTMKNFITNDEEKTQAPDQKTNPQTINLEQLNQDQILKQSDSEEIASEGSLDIEKISVDNKVDQKRVFIKYPTIQIKTNDNDVNNNKILKFDEDGDIQEDNFYQNNYFADGDDDNNNSEQNNIKPKRNNKKNKTLKLSKQIGKKKKQFQDEQQQNSSRKINNQTVLDSEQLSKLTNEDMFELNLEKGTFGPYVFNLKQNNQPNMHNDTTILNENEMTLINENNISVNYQHIQNKYSFKKDLVNQSNQQIQNLSMVQQTAERKNYNQNKQDQSIRKDTNIIINPNLNIINSDDKQNNSNILNSDDKNNQNKKSIDLSQMQYISNSNLQIDASHMERKKSTSKIIIQLDKTNEKGQFDIKDQIFQLKKKLKTIKYWKSQSLNQKSIDEQKVKDFDINSDYFVSEDEDAMQYYSKQINDNMVDLDEEANFNIQSGQQQEDEEEVDLNNNFIMKKALLKDANIELIKKLEIDYFQDCYGNFFNVFHEVNVGPILKFEAHLFSNFSRLIRHLSFQQDRFYQCLEYMETSISDIILRKGSIFKFVFQDSRDNWFCLSYVNNQVVPCLMQKGPWNFSNDVFMSHQAKKKKDIYLSRDFFYIPADQNNALKSIISEFYDSFKFMSESLTENDFCEIDPDKNIFDFYTFFSDCEDSAKIKQNTQKLSDIERLKYKKQKREEKIKNKKDQEQKKEQKMSQLNFYPSQNSHSLNQRKKFVNDIKIHVKRVQIVALAYVGESQQVESDEEENPLNGQESTDNQLKSKKSNYNFGATSGKQQINKLTKQKKHNFNEKFNKLRENKETKDKDKINEKSSLPPCYIVEMLENLQDILNCHQDNLLSNVTLLINQIFENLNEKEQITTTSSDTESEEESSEQDINEQQNEGQSVNKDQSNKKNSKIKGQPNNPTVPSFLMQHLSKIKDIQEQDKQQDPQNQEQESQQKQQQQSGKKSRQLSRQTSYIKQISNSKKFSKQNSAFLDKRMSDATPSRRRVNNSQFHNLKSFGVELQNHPVSKGSLSNFSDSQQSLQREQGNIAPPLSKIPEIIPPIQNKCESQQNLKIQSKFNKNFALSLQPNSLSQQDDQKLKKPILSQQDKISNSKSPKNNKVLEQDQKIKSDRKNQQRQSVWTLAAKKQKQMGKKKIKLL